MSELAVLQAVRMKGRGTADSLLAAAGVEAEAGRTLIGELIAAGLVTGPERLRLSTAGTARLLELLREERRVADVEQLLALYSAFRDVNVAFKSLIADWQIKQGVVNSHDDPDYDAAVLDRLKPIHHQVISLIETASLQLPRLSSYVDRLSSALRKIDAGDATWLTRPIVDSYHTVWFELHEELIGAAGLTREAEAAAGHAD